MRQWNTVLLIAVGALLLWLVGSGRVNNIGKAWAVLIAPAS